VCLIVVALGCHADFPVILAGNRDEFHRRPAAPAHRWQDAPDVVAGRDLEKGGTWLGVSRRGALAVVTNYRDPSRPRNAAAPSRGAMVTDFLLGDSRTAESFLQGNAHPESAYDGFNLIAGDRTGLWYGSNRGDAPTRLADGVHALSNHLLGTPWPKVRRLRQAMHDALATDTSHPIDETLFAALRDRTVAPDHDLPDTGIGLDWERRLAPAFIVSPDYGTRCSTVLTIDRNGLAILQEHTFAPDGRCTGRVRAAVRMPGLPGQA
jgi:uncharacterized protein with NRDE domain